MDEQNDNCLLSIVNYPVCKKVFKHVQDVGICRLVCSGWNEMILTDPAYIKSSCMVFNGERLACNLSKYPMPIAESGQSAETQCKVIINFLHGIKFKLRHNVNRVVMNEMSIAKLMCFSNEKDVSTLMSNSMLGVKELKFVNSEFTEVTPFFCFLKFYPNLEILSCKNSYFMGEFISYTQQAEFLIETEGNPIWTVKTVEIFENKMKTSMALNLLPLLQQKPGVDNLRLEEFKLQVQNYGCSTEEAILHGNMVGRLVQENDATLKQLSLDIKCAESHYNDAVFVEQIWLNYQPTLQMESLNVNCKNLESGIIPGFFENVLLRGIFFSNNLLNFELGKFHLYNTMPLPLEQLIGACDMKLRVIVSDSSQEINQARRLLLKSQFMVSSLKELEVHWMMPSCNGFNFIFPMNNDDDEGDERTKYEQMDQFSLYLEGVLPLYKSFDIEQLVRVFPNLTVFKIHDKWAEDFNDFEERPKSTKHKYKTEAKVTDEDLQHILLTLTCLEKLHLQADLSHLTDAGFTGTLSKTGESTLNGVSFANLRYLEEVYLSDLGPGITNATAMHGFTGGNKLKRLELYGNTKMDKTGVGHLQAKYQRRFGCTVIVGIGFI